MAAKKLTRLSGRLLEGRTQTWAQVREKGTADDEKLRAIMVMTSLSERSTSQNKRLRHLGLGDNKQDAETEERLAAGLMGSDEDVECP
ncbi:uncharacterized protein PGTG_13697 [Puccinia graminis f. sp. tritici CRL 75-36-700-3]|uniref:Uncharacterized protein n=1 Tax=Puccinia graminis f. sp. tritici (strain CRL 75-36-700-3 / race SCCL) TaxID=418459 RepID=E3KST9_PUCGT|nr:uncharacterized protein PGTG_13697 [Puccinia graminis f. sp. tritici CRL 75-36-700-3]EFP87469.2 hypothetical protein PGTG_13697 [Puccinia graminis f. sp. tritici CRL 75-36-700-3]